VAGGVDRLDAREPEVPLEVGLDERRHEPAGGGVDVDRHVEVTLRVHAALSKSLPDS
jgi:hypothetical protein